MRHFDRQQAQIDKQFSDLRGSFPPETHGPRSVDELETIEDARIRMVAQRICAVDRGLKLVLAVDVGRIVVEGIFGGDTPADGNKHESFGKLAAHPETPYCKTTLWRYVQTYELVTRLSWVVGEPFLTLNHIREVYGVARAEQGEWLRAAVTNKWNAKQLGARVRASNQVRRSRGEPVQLLRVARRMGRLAGPLAVPERPLRRSEVTVIRAAIEASENLAAQMRRILDDE